MVSSVLGMSVEELVQRLEQIGEEYADDPDYRELRSALPDEFPF
jgi:hypothetical protein